MKGIILAAGRGSRMKSLTFDRPKCLLKIKGTSLLNRQINSFRSAGIDDISIVTGYKNEMLSEYGLKEFHNSRWDETQMFFSLTKAESLLSKSSCIVSYSDIFFSSSVVKELINNDSKLAITYDKNWSSLWSKRFKEPLDDAESFKVNSLGYLIEIGNSVDKLEDIDGQYMGLIKITPEGWTDLNKIYQKLSIAEKENIHFTKLLNYLTYKLKNYIKAIPIDSVWGEVDTENDFNLYNNDSFYKP